MASAAAAALLLPLVFLAALLNVLVSAIVWIFLRGKRRVGASSDTLKILDDLSRPHWEVSTPKNFSQFFQNIAKLLPPNSVLCLEDVYPDRAFLDFLNARKISATVEPRRGTLWPRREMFQLPATGENLSQLEHFITTSDPGATPRHVHANHGDTILLQWFDASMLDEPMCVSTKIPEAAVREFCAAMGSELSTYDGDDSEK